MKDQYITREITDIDDELQKEIEKRYGCRGHFVIVHTFFARPGESQEGIGQGKV